MVTRELDNVEMCEAAQQLYNLYSTILSETRLSSILFDILGCDYLDREREESARSLINNLVLNYYPNEATIKANFIDRVLLPQSPETISIFELPIGNSRVDMCKVNGHSAAYEIKTDLDTFDRLEGQLRDYFDVFETVYVVTSDIRWRELPSYVPDECGIYSYRQDNTDGSYHFCARRRPTKSTELDAEKQLRVLPKQVLCELFDINGKQMSKPDLVRECLAENSREKINRLFKVYLKQRYGSYWSRFRKLQPSIYGIDYAWFYRNGLDPSIVY